MLPSAKLLAAPVLAALLLGAAPRAHAADNYDIQQTDVKATVGTKAVASVTISAKKGWHVNAEAPLTMKLAPEPGIAVDKNRLTRADLAESTQDRARFDVPFTASEAGKKTIAVEASFVMCQATTCQPVKEKLTLAVEAVPAAKKK
jgi:hypothetical protein